MSEFEREVDVVVVGSGGAGLSSAVAAASAGASVVVLEASHRLGGSTAVSGGQVWVPANPHMADASPPDSFEAARSYCLGQSPGRDVALIEAFLRAGPAMVRGIEAHTPIRFKPMGGPDSFAEQPGGRSDRHLEVEPLEMAEFGPWDEHLWPPSYPAVLTNDEVTGLGLMFGGKLPMDLIQERMAAGQVTLGVGLVTGLLRGCAAAGVELVRSCRVTRLVREPGARVTGVEVERAGRSTAMAARKGVVLAGGGFEWDPSLAGRLLGGPVTHAVSPPLHTGDALRLAAEVGAELAHTAESWCWPVAEDPGRTWDDTASTPRHRLVISERCMPHVIWVNREGRRFVNESSHNCALAFAEIDARDHQLRNVPAWAIGDAQFRERYPVGSVAAGQPAADWLAEADTLAELATCVGIDPDGLEGSVARFNALVAAGRDSDFGRGEGAYDTSMGDPNAPHPTLGTLERPPFFALRIHPGAVGTKGGARTDTHARALDWTGTPIPGLYAAGNAMASVIGPGTIAPGLTLGCALTWGWVAGTHAAGGELLGS